METASFVVGYGHVKLKEGGLAEHPSDPGGATWCGISRRWNPQMKFWKLYDRLCEQFPDDTTGRRGFRMRETLGVMEEVKDFYEGVWNDLNLDKLQSQEISNEIFEAYTLHDAKAVMWLQKALVVMGYYVGSKGPDADLGGITVSAVNAALGDTVDERETAIDHLLETLNAYQRVEVTELRIYNSKLRVFTGWDARSAY